jgi:uncharacterized pyridoxal phosphate-containing UPF0001 family protein
MSIQAQLSHVREKLALAAARSHRAPESINLVAVTKTQSLEALTEALELGLRDLGES